MYSDAPDEQKEDYLRNIVAHCALSQLHSNSSKPYLDYRAAENIFCKSFDAENVSRSDVAIDAVYGDTGIGIKTFVEGTAFQKIAEFDRKSKYNEMVDDLEIVREVSRMRNQRLDVVIEKYKLKSLIYHYTVRYDGHFCVFECPMDYIDVNNIKYATRTGNTIAFTDGHHQYRFHTSKSTILMEFPLDEPLEEMQVRIMDNAMESVVNLYESRFGKITITGQDDKIEELEFSEVIPDNPYIADSVILPLFSYKKIDGVRTRYVPERSGLNQWNAAGRARDAREVYVPVPRYVHRDHPGFFPPRTESFRLELPGGKSLSAKLCQAGDKGLMSKPNKDLGEWLLGTVFELPERKLLTYAEMEEKRINAVRVSKLRTGHYYINFIYVPPDYDGKKSGQLSLVK